MSVMDHFPDTSFLCSLYRLQIFTSQAIKWRDAHREPLPVSTLLLLEFRQSVRLQMRLHSKDRTKGYGLREASAMLRDFQSDLAAGIMRVVPVDWADVHAIAERLSATHTSREGHRLADILHVATALHLGMKGFLTFDERQRDLAEAEGLRVPFRKIKRS